MSSDNPCSLWGWEWFTLVLLAILHYEILVPILALQGVLYTIFLFMLVVICVAPSPSLITRPLLASTYLLSHTTSVYPLFC